MQSSEELVPNIDGRCNCLAARKASRYLTALYDQALQAVGLRATQFSILYKLIRSGTMSIGDLAANMAMDRTTLSANLKPLERDQLLVIAPGEDRRVRCVTVTRTGKALFQRALPLWSTVQAEFEDAYGKKHASDLRRSLDAVLHAGFEPWAGES
jgi:DNA-binding MarR family transcriptional regulator